LARYIEPTAAELILWERWVSGTTPAVRAVAQRFDPWSLYRRRSTGHRVFIDSFGEYPDDRPVSVCVAVTVEFNDVDFDWITYGVPPDDLELCDLPTVEETFKRSPSGQNLEESVDTGQVVLRSG
jgi:hypothetical protein